MQLKKRSVKGKITITTQKTEGMIHIKITDTGKGIPEQNLPRIFDPFFTTKGVTIPSRPPTPQPYWRQLLTEGHLSTKRSTSHFPLPPTSCSTHYRGGGAAKIGCGPNWVDRKSSNSFPVKLKSQYFFPTLTKKS